MSDSTTASPLTRDQVIDRYFLEHRAKVLDLAAYLDRLDRSAGGPGDFREQALHNAIALLIDGQPDRAQRILESLSDPTTDPVDQASGKGATGAYNSC